MSSYRDDGWKADLDRWLTREDTYEPRREWTSEENYNITTESINIALMEAELSTTELLDFIYDDEN